MKATGLVILSAIILLLGYDLFVVLHDGNYDHTISQWVYTMSKEFMIIPVLVGIVIGHFFWPIHEGDA